MIGKSILYKLVRKSDYMIIAEGNAKEMTALRKRTPGTCVGVGSPSSQIGKVFTNPSHYTLIQKEQA